MRCLNIFLYFTLFNTEQILFLSWFNAAHGATQETEVQK